MNPDTEKTQFEHTKLSSKMISRLAIIQTIYINELYETPIPEAQSLVRSYMSDIYGLKKDTDFDTDIRITFRIDDKMLSDLTQCYNEYCNDNVEKIKQYTHMTHLNLSGTMMIAIQTAMNEHKLFDTHPNVLIKTYTDIISSLGFSDGEISFANATLESLLTQDK